MKRTLSLSGLALGLLLVLSAPRAAAQGRGVAEDIAIRAGLVITNNPAYDSLVRIEFPFTLNRQQFEFYRPDTADPTWYARIFAQAILIDARGLPFDSVSTYFSASASSREVARASEVTLFNTLTMFARPGLYTARLQVIDAVSKRENEVFYEKVVADAAGSQLTIGGERLAYRIRAVDPDSNGGLKHLVRNGLEILTNPVGLFGMKDTVMYIYGEIYNLAYDSTEPSKYSLGYRILDTDGYQVRDLGYSMKQKPGQSAVIAQRFEIGDLTAGFYTLETSVGDAGTGQADTAVLEFRIISPDEISSMVAEYETSADPWDSLSLEQQTQVIHFMLTPEQRTTLDGLTDEGKKNFMAQFWGDHDELPQTPLNETRVEMIRRWKFANSNFSLTSPYTDGWRSDRGRIYLTYGHWEEQDNHPAPVAGQPFTIWYYRSLEEGLVFVFTDRRGFGEYELEHSNADGERFDPDWDRRIKDQSFFEFEQDFDGNTSPDF